MSGDLKDKIFHSVSRLKWEKQCLDIEVTKEGCGLMVLVSKKWVGSRWKQKNNYISLESEMMCEAAAAAAAENNLIYLKCTFLEVDLKQPATLSNFPLMKLFRVKHVNLLYSSQQNPWHITWTVQLFFFPLLLFHFFSSHPDSPSSALKKFSYQLQLRVCWNLAREVRVSLQGKR